MHRVVTIAQPGLILLWAGRRNSGWASGSQRPHIFSFVRPDGSGRCSNHRNSSPGYDTVDPVRIGVIPRGIMARPARVIDSRGTTKKLPTFQVRLNSVDPVAWRRRVCEYISVSKGIRMNWILFIVILRVLQQAESDLFQVAGTRGASRVFSGTREDRKENRRQQSYHSDNHEQFDESEPALLRAFTSLPMA